MSWIIFILTALILIWILLKSSLVSGSFLSKKFVIAAFAAKVIAGTALTLIYTFYYTERGAADIYKFFDDAQVIASTLEENPGVYFRFISGVDEENPELIPYRKAMHNWEPQSPEWLEFTQTKSYNIFTSNRIITRINAILLPYSRGNIFTHVLFFSFLITLASVAFSRAVFLKNKPQLLPLVLLFFWPSVLLWCSAPLKDSLTLSALFFCWYRFTGIFNNKKIIFNLVSILFWLLILLFTKYYVIPALLAAMLIYTVHYFSSAGNKMRNGIITSLGLVLVVFLIDFALVNHPVSSILNNKREEALKAAIFGEARQMAFVNLASSGTVGMLQEAPISVFRAIFHPLVPEKDQPVILWPSLLENVALLLLCSACLFRLVRRKNPSQQSIVFLVFVVSLAFIIGYTTPVTGGLVRYKTAFIPFLIIACASALPQLKGEIAFKAERFCFNRS
ncbi:MAG: hypothetical protein R2850_12685 [Bacteroidia bacterium]